MQLLIAEHDVIETLTHVAEPFFNEILGMELDDCLVTDDSTLSDFSFCGMPTAPSELEHDTPDLRSLYQRWDDHVLSLIQQKYGITLESTVITLVQLFVRIDEKGRPATVH